MLKLSEFVFLVIAKVTLSIHSGEELCRLRNVMRPRYSGARKRIPVTFYAADSHLGKYLNSVVDEPDIRLTNP